MFGRLRQGPSGSTMENKKESSTNEAEKVVGKAAVYGLKVV